MHKDSAVTVQHPVEEGTETRETKLRDLEEAGDARPDFRRVAAERVALQQHPGCADDGGEADDIGQEQPEARAAKDALVKGVIVLQLLPAYGSMCIVYTRQRIMCLLVVSGLHCMDGMARQGPWGRGVGVIG